MDEEDVSQEEEICDAKEAVDHLQALIDDAVAPEGGHSVADDILCATLRGLGASEVVEAYNRVASSLGFCWYVEQPKAGDAGS